MKERPILFNGEMVRAILEGRKTQTRRVMKVQPLYRTQMKFCVPNNSPKKWHDASDIMEFCPFGKIGDRLWVRETWQCFHVNGDDPIKFNPRPNICSLGFKATDHERSVSYVSEEFKGPWVPSIHMPRWASRINLEITNVRVERLQEITEQDAKAEGFGIDEHYFKSTPRVHFGSIWEKLYGLQSWISNPWVWVIEFKAVKP